MATITIDGTSHTAAHVPTAQSNVLLIQAGCGFLGCGYFSVAVADRLGDAVAIVRGVKTLEEMLEVPVEEASRAAQERGVTVGMSGREALRILTATAPQGG